MQTPQPQTHGLITIDSLDWSGFCKWVFNIASEQIVLTKRDEDHFKVCRNTRIIV
jgi:hypothetical protein